MFIIYLIIILNEEFIFFTYIKIIFIEKKETITFKYINFYKKLKN